MPELLKEAFGLHNLPVTVLLGIMIVYWVLVMIGATDVDMDGPDVHVDGGHIDASHGGSDIPDGHGGSDGGMPFGGHTDGHGHGAHSQGHGPSPSGFWQTCGRLLHLGEVPLMIVLSVLSLFMWAFSITTNYLFNGTPGNRDAFIALLLLVPNLIAGLLFTRVALSPLSKLIRRMQSTESEVEAVLGREATVVSSEVTETFGQIEIAARGMPVTVNARVAPGRPSISKGTAVLVYEAGPEAVFYFVRPLNSITE